MKAGRAEKAGITAGEGLVEIDGDDFYAIPAVDRMPPFLMSVVSDGDRWMFVSSSGALTAGRADAAGALFPYETDDRLHQSAGITGPVTAIRVAEGGADRLWSPFHRRPRTPVDRRLAKAVVGDSIVFEESHPGLGLRFRYRWSSSTRFGFVRTAILANEGRDPVRLDLVDGLLNLLPHGLDPSIYQGMSNLTNAYKRSEVVDPGRRLAVFSLESMVMDRPEPAEVLRGSTAWSVGLGGASVTVDPDALAAFERGGPVEPVPLVTGRPGAYLLSAAVDLEPGEEVSWHIVCDVGQDQVAVTGLRRLLGSEPDLPAAIAASVAEARASLVAMMAPADARQRTGDRIATAHQFANVTYNVMRGGVPVSGYRITTGDFERFVLDRNRPVAERHRDWFASLPPVIERRDLLGRIASDGDVDLVRLGLEYLPFGFSRRHGDPSRPWNAFSIRVRDRDGEPIVYYEGNWRDIFQNWEALSAAFPGYLTGMISVFVNASTADGFNPYRITRLGVDWEVPDPGDPWSNIGYWGDHQIVYLLRLLEAGERFVPGEVERMLGERWFTFADVPYRIVPYEELVRHPKATIRYDRAAAARSEARAGEIGGDGRLLRDRDGDVIHVTLLEKLLVPALAKLSNFVPGGGIWMNTQRPEWNDANNALVGFGLSVVTLCQLRRYLAHLRSLVGRSGLDRAGISPEVAEWLAAVAGALAAAPPPADRTSLMDTLGAAFSAYRDRVYAAGLSEPVPLTAGAVLDLCDAAIEHLDDTVRSSRRPDGLYHSYNLIRFDADGACVEPLGEMLEGQVAVLSSRVLTPGEQADVIDALFAGGMYRADQRSFMLYPARRLPSFLEKNVVPPEAVAGNRLLTGLLDAGDGSVIVTDADGRFRFSPGLSNRSDLEAALDRLAGDPRWSGPVDAHRNATLDAYEGVFRHHAYTGRSGSMYAYEGIGSIYWHMVAKLLVAVQEAAFDAVTAGAPPDTIRRLTDGYWRIRSGLGFNKTAAEFGAIPIDPYSHTPSHAGAQQPGMTGLVKEELLTRPAEVGVRVDGGRIRFDPLFLRREELLTQPESWRVSGSGPEVVELGPGSLGMTLCQVPVIVSATDGAPHVEVELTDGATLVEPGLAVDRETSAAVFARTGRVARIHAHVPSDRILG